MVKEGLVFILVLVALNVTSLLGYGPAIIISFVIQLAVAAFIALCVIMASGYCIVKKCWRDHA